MPYTDNIAAKGLMHTFCNTGYIKLFMTTREIIKTHKKICDNATASRLFDALDGIGTILKNLKIDEFQAEYENITGNYQNLLSYTVKGVNDPQRSQVLNSLIIAVIELTDKIKEHYLEQNNLTLLQNKRNSYNKLSRIQAKLNETIDSQQYSTKISDLLGESNITFDNEELETKHQTFRNDLFDYILYSDKLSDSDILFIRNIFGSEYFKCLTSVLL